MASYRKEKNGTYTLRYRVRDAMGNDSNKGIRGFKREKDAKNYYEREIIPTLNAATATNIGLKFIYQEFLKFKKVSLKDSSILSLMDMIDGFVIPYFGDKNIFDIKTVDIMKWHTYINGLTHKDQGKNVKPYSYNYKIKMRVNLYALLEFAKAYGLKDNPVTGVKGFTNNTLAHTGNFWSQEEFEKFIKVVGSPMYKMFFLCLYLTGCRKGELLALQWSDVDFDKHCIRITKTYTRKILDKSENNFKLTLPKNKTSIREILLPEVLIVELKAYYETQKKIHGFTESSYVFGVVKPISENAIDHMKKKYCTIAEVKNIRIHDFRHSHASLLVNSGQNILVVAQRLGHSNIEQTLNTYSHMFANKQEELLKSLNVTIK